MNFRDYLTLRSARKAFKSLRNDFRLHCDVLPPETRSALEERLTDLHQAIRCRETEDLPAVIATVRAELDDTLPKPKWPWASEWFDVIVSALAVAFCFRAYYYQPFKIPTGSMQPTLYGIHAEPGGTPTAWDRQPLRFLKWCVTGATYQDIRVRRSGRVVEWRSGAVPGYASLFVNAAGRVDRYDIPEAAVGTLRSTFQPGMGVRAGTPLWRGTVHSGDFLFVNRWIWNFRHPRLGETIVFSTRGLPGLPPDQHYIKRLCGRPGDTVELRPNDSRLWVNGEPALKPRRLCEIADHASPWPGAPAYPGYQAAVPGGPYAVTMSHFELGPGRYLALGDNSPNSLDSRYWGTVPAKNLLGPATFVHWPFASPRWGNVR